MFEKNELNASAISLLFVISLFSIRSTWSCLHFFDFEFNARRSTSHVSRSDVIGVISLQLRSFLEVLLVVQTEPSRRWPVYSV